MPVPKQSAIANRLLAALPRMEVQRLAAGQFEKRKLIEYSRGNITVLERRGLEAASCSCYQIVRNIRS